MDSLNYQQIEQFVRDGFVRIDNAFSDKAAEAARDILWKDTGCEPTDRSTWLRPVVWLGMYNDPLLVEPANSSKLYSAFDQLVGPGKWLPCRSMGSFPVRFPTDRDTGDCGWHVDASFPGANPSDYLQWRINYKSRGRGLLMLFLFSDVGERDAPTRLKIGSHSDVARILHIHGENGLSLMELAEKLNGIESPETNAIGKAGTVYLCHPFLVHAAQPNRGSSPRFLAQPPLLLKEALCIDEPVEEYYPVERAIRMALGFE